MSALAACDLVETARYDPGERRTAFVERVVDGDTAVMRVGGERVYVRYIGIDTPESVKPDSPVECGGPQASAFNAEQVEGREVQLEFDQELYDPFDRLLAYVRVNGRLVNARLVREGYATAVTYLPNDRYRERFEALERSARDRSVGIWSSC